MHFYNANYSFWLRFIYATTKKKIDFVVSVLYKFIFLFEIYEGRIIFDLFEIGSFIFFIVIRGLSNLNVYLTTMLLFKFNR